MLEAPTIKTCSYASSNSYAKPTQQQLARAPQMPTHPASNPNIKHPQSPYNVENLQSHSLNSPEINDMHL